MFDCYDLLGSPDDPEDTDMVAECAAHVINKIQMGKKSHCNYMTNLFLTYHQERKAIGASIIASAMGKPANQEVSRF